MGWYVETLVTFDAEGDEVPMLAQKALSTDGREWSTEARIVLSAVAEGRGYTQGPKGGIWAVAFTGNYTSGAELAKELLPFFQSLWETPTRVGPMLDFHHGVIITQDEQTGSSRLFVVKHPGTIEEHVGPALWHSG